MAMSAGADQEGVARSSASCIHRLPAHHTRTWPSSFDETSVATAMKQCLWRQVSRGGNTTDARTSVLSIDLSGCSGENLVSHRPGLPEYIGTGVETPSMGKVSKWAFNRMSCGAPVAAGNIDLGPQSASEIDESSFYETVVVTVIELSLVAKCHASGTPRMHAPPCPRLL